MADMRNSGRASAPGTPATSVRDATANESTPPEQRKPDVVEGLSEGPVKGINDNFEPAKYKLESGNIRTDR